MPNKIISWGFFPTVFILCLGVAGCDDSAKERSPIGKPRRDAAADTSTAASGNGGKTKVGGVSGLVSSFLQNPRTTVEGWAEKLDKPGGIAAVRSDLRDISRDHTNELVKALDGTRNVQLKAIISSILVWRASKLGAHDGTALLLRIEPQVGVELRGALQNCAGQWTINMEKDVVLEQIREFRRLAPHLDTEFNLLNLYAGTSVNDDPLKVLEVVHAEASANPSQATEAYRSAATRVTPGRLPAFHDELLKRATEGTPHLGSALVTVARRMSENNPDDYAQTLEAYRGQPNIYNSLTMGYIQSVVRVDPESAEAWANTISDPKLRSAAETLLTHHRR